MMLATALLAGASVAAAEEGAGVSGLYGLTLIKNSPSAAGFFKMDLSTGEMEIIGGSQTILAASGDLRAIDNKRGIYYYLGDTHKGTTLAGIDMTDGSLACSSVVALKEIGFVGTFSGE